MSKFEKVRRRLWAKIQKLIASVSRFDDAFKGKEDSAGKSMKVAIIDHLGVRHAFYSCHLTDSSYLLGTPALSVSVFESFRSLIHIRLKLCDEAASKI